MKQKIIGRTIIAPAPVMIVCSYDENGTPNAMNAVWCGQCARDEIAVNLVPSRKTTENILKTHAFTVSVGTAATLDVCDYFGITYGHNENKIQEAGVNVHKSDSVNAPVLDCFPLTLECKVISTHTERGETRIVGKIENVLADESIITSDGHIDYEALCPIYYDSENKTYRIIGRNIGNALQDGKSIKNKKAIC